MIAALVTVIAVAVMAVSGVVAEKAPNTLVRRARAERTCDAETDALRRALTLAR